MTAAALVALTGCTGSFADASTGSSAADSASPSTSAPAASTTATAAPSAAATSSASGSSFCVQAGKLLARTDPRSVDTTKPDTAAAFFTQAAKDMRAVTAPSAISADWTSVATGLGDLAQAYGNADLSTVAGESRLERAITQIQTQIGPSQNHVNAYLQQTCGIGNAGSTATTSNPAPVLVPSPHAP